MAYSLRLTTALIVVALLPIAASQGVIVAYDPLSVCESLNSTLCEGYGVLKDDLIFVNSTVSQSALTAELQLQFDQIDLLDLLGFTACAKGLRQYACLTYFTPCNLVDAQSSQGLIAMPAPPCYSSCKTVESVCTPVFATLGRPFPGCPPVATTYDASAIGGGSVIANCTEFGNANATVQETCPISNVWWGKKFTQANRIVSSVCGWVGFIACLLVLVLTAANPATRKWPGPLLIILSFAQMLLAFGTSMSSWITHEARVCSDEAFDINVCRAQGFFIIAGIHLGITTWLVLTCITAYSVWSGNPATAIKNVYHIRWYLAIVLIVPVAFIIYLSLYLGTLPVSCLCLTNRSDVEEHALVIPLLAQVCIGTLLWMVSIVGTVKTLGFQKRGLSRPRQFRLYVRMFLYETLAIVPSAIFTFPIEIYRSDFLALDRGEIDQKFIYVGLKRIVLGSTAAAASAPLLFAVIFLVRREHFDFLRGVVRTYSTASSKNNSAGNDPNNENSKF